jgi:hypothetical protein
MNLDQAVIDKLAKSGIEFGATVKTPWGCDTIFILPNEILSFVRDKEEYAAKHFGTKLETYYRWIETGGTPQCGARTVTGSRCRNYVGGGIHMKIENWFELDGGFCAVHGGESSEEAHMQRFKRK